MYIITSMYTLYLIHTSICNKEYICLQSSHLYMNKFRFNNSCIWKATWNFPGNLVKKATNASPPPALGPGWKTPFFGMRENYFCCHGNWRTSWHGFMSKHLINCNVKKKCEGFDVIGITKPHFFRTQNPYLPL